MLGDVGLDALGAVAAWSVWGPELRRRAGTPAKRVPRARGDEPHYAI